MDEFKDINDFRKKDWPAKVVTILLLACLGAFWWVVFDRLAQTSATKAESTDVEYLSSRPTLPRTKLEEDVVAASFYVYMFFNDGSGGSKHCSATVFEQTGPDTYYLLTASHCVARDDFKSDTVQAKPFNLFVATQLSDCTIHAARLVAAGFQRRGDDFAVLEAHISHQVKVIPLAKRNPRVGEKLVNVSYPLKGTRRIFNGHVLIEHLDLPVPIPEKTVGGPGAMKALMKSAMGASGSALVSLDQNAIVGVLVGGEFNDSQSFSNKTTGFPVSKFRAFWEAVQAGEYPWYQPPVSLADGGSAASDSEF